MAGINTNIASLNAQRNLGKSQNALQTSLQRLSSGLRINSAKDDAAGLSISNRMTTQVNGLNQGIRNANDGISVAQTAEGALQESTVILQRMRQLSLQASSDANTDADRATIQLEVAQLITELDRIATTTAFNGKNLLDGTFGTSKFQVGSEAGETISVTVGSARTSVLGGSDSTTSSGASQATTVSSVSTSSTETNASNKGSLIALSAAELEIQGVEIGASSSGNDTLSTTDNGASAIAIAAAINDKASSTGVYAQANATTFTFDVAANTAQTASFDAGDFKINGINVAAFDVASTVTTNAALASAIRAEFNKITSATGVVAATGTDSQIVLVAADGRNINFHATEATAGDVSDYGIGSASTTFNKVARGTVSLYSNEAITVGGSNPGGGDFTEATTSTTEDKLQAVASTTANTFTELAQGELAINGIMVDFENYSASVSGTASLERSSVEAKASAMYIAGAINNTTGLKDQITATATTTQNLGKVSALGSDTAVDTFQLIFQSTSATQYDGTATGDEVGVTFTEAIKENDSDGYLVGTINTALAASTVNGDSQGMFATVNSSGELLIVASDGRNIRTTVDNTATGDTTEVTATQFLANFDTTVQTTDVITKGTIALTAKTGYSLSSIEGAKQAYAGIEGGVDTIAKVDVSTFEGAQKALSSIDKALSQIDDTRAALGAVQNRFESTISNLGSISENVAAARARILDADFAIETANLTKAQILQQAGTSILAQANQLPQSVLSLLQ